MSFSPSEWIQLVSTGAIMPVLVFMLYKDMNKRYENERKEAVDRENRLMTVTEKQGENLNRMVIALEGMEKRMERIENRVYKEDVA